MLISVYNKLSLIPVPCFLVMTCDTTTFKGYINMNKLWERMEHYDYNSNSNYYPLLRFIKDRLLLLDRSCNYIRNNRQQSLSIGAGEKELIL